MCIHKEIVYKKEEHRKLHILKIISCSNTKTFVILAYTKVYEVIFYPQILVELVKFLLRKNRVFMRQFNKFYLLIKEL